MSAYVSAELDASTESVWSVVGDFAGLQRWHPQVERCETDGEGVGAVRTIHFADWWAVERLDRLDEQRHSIAYTLTDSSRPAVIGVSSTINLSPLPDDRTRIDWTSGLPADHPHAATINEGLQAYYPARIGHLSAALADDAAA